VKRKGRTARDCLKEAWNKPAEQETDTRRRRPGRAGCLCILDDCEVEAEWVARCLTDFDQVWDALSPENHGRLVRAVFERVEVDEPSGDVRVFATSLNASPAADVGAIAVNS
jgi:hypothetical protein